MFHVIEGQPTYMFWLRKCYRGRVLVSSGLPQVTIREGLERTCSGVEYLFVLGREASIGIESSSVVIAPATAERFSSINVFQPRNVLSIAWHAKHSGVFEIRHLNRSVCLLSIFKQLRVVERIEDVIFVLIFFIWDTVLANQNDDVVDAELVTFVIRWDKRIKFILQSSYWEPRQCDHQEGSDI